jgi:hypothetical protein
VELRALAAAVVALAALGLLGLRVVQDRTEAGFDDLGTWRITADGRALPKDHRDLLRVARPHRPFRLVLALDGPGEDDPRRLAAHRSFPADPAAGYCLDVLVTSDHQRKRRGQGFDPFATAVATRVVVEEEREAELTIAERRSGELVRIDGIEPGPDGRVDVSFEIEALKTPRQTSWAKLSLVRFEFARFYRCDDGEAD